MDPVTGAPFFTDTHKRYLTQDYAFRRTFGRKMVKVPLSTGMTCPNRDGSRGVGGCIFCSGAGSGDFAGRPGQSLQDQFEQVLPALQAKWPQAGKIAYFQSFSNTYAPAERVLALAQQALALPGVQGLSIATRADCISPEMAKALGQLARRHWLEVELGLQSIHPQTAAAIGRGHSLEEFLAGFGLLREEGVQIGVHLINGLPGEDAGMMRQSAAWVGALRPHSVKLHMLTVLRGTQLGRRYEQAPFPLLGREEYVSIVCDQLELLPPQVVIQRLTGDAPRPLLLAPLWTVRKREVLNEIDKELRRRSSWQGRRLAGEAKGCWGF